MRNNNVLCLLCWINQLKWRWGQQQHLILELVVGEYFFSFPWELKLYLLPSMMQHSPSLLPPSKKIILRFPFSLDVIFHPWKKEETGNQSRVILYTITLTNPLAPKTATVTETQVRSSVLAFEVLSVEVLLEIGTLSCEEPRSG